MDRGRWILDFGLIEVRFDRSATIERTHATSSATASATYSATSLFRAASSRHATQVSFLIVRFNYDSYFWGSEFGFNKVVNRCRISKYSLAPS